MVRIVLVAHSRALAEALVDFARQMAGEEVRIDVAAGAGDDGEDFGTDASAIVEAIMAGDVEDGVLLLVDVGSGILSTEMALELLPDDVREKVRLCPAPFVEGTLSASVQASLGAPFDEVYREAFTALEQKRNQIEGEFGEPVPPAEEPADDSEAVEREVTIINEHGLHARPAAQFVRAAARHDARVTVEDLTSGRGPVSATSISAVSTLGAVKDHTLRLRASGAEAEATLDALEALINDAFGEHEQPAETEVEVEAHATNGTAEATDAIEGVPIMRGTALGPAVVYRPQIPDLPDEPPDDPEAAWEAFEQTLDEVREALGKEAASGPADVSGILDAQQLLLSDEEVLGRVRDAVVDETKPVALAWNDTVTAVAEEYEALDDPYLQQRAADVRDVNRRVVLHLLGDPESAAMNLPGDPFVLLAQSLVPSEVISLPDDRVLGVVCAAGNPTAHSAILLRSRGIPTVFGAGETVMDVADGTMVAIDGGDGLVWLDPEPDVRERLEEQKQRQDERARAQREAAQEAAETANGTVVSVEANINHPSDAEAAARFGADGVGLLRTEFLFVDRDEPPSEKAQIEHLTAVAAALGGRPVTVRALDVGGDKPLRYAPQPEEHNPFLGLRGIRVLLRQPGLFRSQLRAIVQVAAEHPIRLLLPMIATPGEVAEARALLNEVRDELGAADVSLPVGIMIETPASALAAHRFLGSVDFFSIGTNDLTQYTMAADREHANLGDLSDALHPPVLHLMQYVAQSAATADVPVSICGELAGDIDAVPVLLGLGIHRLSVSPPAIPSIKATVRKLNISDARELAAEALQCDDASAVRKLSRGFWEEHAPEFSS